MRADRSSASRLSVVHVCSPAEVGGLERVIQGVAVGLARRSFRVTVVAVVSPQTDPSAFLAPIRASGATAIVCRVARWQVLRERAMITRILQDSDADVLHTHGYRPDLLHAAPARRAGIATVSTVHGSSRMGGLSHAFEWLQEIALRGFDAVIAVSPPLYDALRSRGVAAERLHLVTNGRIPVACALDRQEARAVLGLSTYDIPVIGWVGRLIPIKGADIFLKSLAALQTREWIACVIGDGPERSPLAELVERMGLANRVRFIGAVPDAATLLAAFDVFVLSSRSEGTPMVLLEAMGAALPVIATNVGGVPFILGGGEGWLVPPESPADLARAITEVISDRTEAQARGTRAMQAVRQTFGIENWIDRYEQVYLSAVEFRQDPSRDRRKPDRLARTFDDIK